MTDITRSKMITSTSQCAVGVTVRAGTTEDVAHVRRMEEKWVGDDQTIGLQPTPEDMLREFVGGCFFVAERRGEIVGFVYGCIKLNEGAVSAVMAARQRYVDLENLYVLSAHRSAGIGAKLIDRVAEWARRENISYLLTYSSSRDVDRVLRFYRLCGFQSWSVQMFRDLSRE